MSDPSRSDTDEQQVRTLIATRVDAVRRKNVEDATAHHAPDVMMFDVITPARYVGAGAVRRRTAEWFSSFDGPIGYDVRDVDVTAAGEVAFCHFLFHVNGTLRSGAVVRMWVRATLGLRKLDGRWQITHEHNSAPMDPSTGKAALESDIE